MKMRIGDFYRSQDTYAGYLDNEGQCPICDITQKGPLYKVVYKSEEQILSKVLMPSEKVKVEAKHESMENS